MSTWRRKALEAFPELREELTEPHEIESVYSLWFELLPMARSADDDGDTDLLRRIYEYAHLVSAAPSKELWNPVGVAFLEHLFDDATEARMRDVLAWLADDVVQDVWGLWQWRLEGDKVEIVRRLLREQNRPVPEDMEEVRRLLAQQTRRQWW